MRGSVVLLLVALISLFPVAVCFGDEILDDPGESEMAADLLDDDFEEWRAELNIRSGFLYAAKSKEFAPYGTVKFVGYGPFALEAGVEFDPGADRLMSAGLLALTYNVGNLRKWGVEMDWAEHLAVNLGPFVRYDFVTEEYEAGILLSVLDLSRVNASARANGSGSASGSATLDGG